MVRREEMVGSEALPDQGNGRVEEDAGNPRIGDQSVTVMLRAKVAEVKNFLRESGKDGVFTKEKDPREERAVKAAVIWLPKDETLGIARDKAVEVDNQCHHTRRKNRCHHRSEPRSDSSTGNFSDGPTATPDEKTAR